MAGRVASARIGGGAQVRSDKGRWTPAVRNIFLAELAQTANVRLSARAAKRSVPGAYKLRKRDPAFARAWDEALDEGYAKLELLLLERSLAGLTGDVVAPGDGSKLAALSERGLFSLLAHRRQSVREVRAAAADPLDEDRGVRARLEAKLKEMEARMEGGDG